jgi:hypothetical protein
MDTHNTHGAHKHAVLQQSLQKLSAQAIIAASQGTVNSVNHTAEAEIKTG